MYDKREHLAQATAARDTLAAMSRAGTLDAEGWADLQFFRAEVVRLEAELACNGSIPANATNVTPLPVAKARQADPAARMAAIRDRAIARYRADMRARNGCDPFDVHAAIALDGLRKGTPMMCLPSMWLLDPPEASRDA